MSFAALLAGSVAFSGAAESYDRPAIGEAMFMRTASYVNLSVATPSAVTSSATTLKVWTIVVLTTISPMPPGSPEIVAVLS